jgi:hypothetical protein
MPDNEEKGLSEDYNTAVKQYSALVSKLIELGMALPRVDTIRCRLNMPMNAARRLGLLCLDCMRPNRAEVSGAPLRCLRRCPVTATWCTPSIAYQRTSLCDSSFG